MQNNSPEVQEMVAALGKTQTTTRMPAVVQQPISKGIRSSQK